MLPFLKKDRAGTAGLSIEYRKPDNKEQPMDDGLEACVDELIKAINANDVKAAARAWRAGFEILDSQPHEEYDHDQDNSYSE